MGSADSSSPGSRTIVEADRLFDGHDFVVPARVAFVDGRVEAVGASVVGDADVSLSGMTLLPGLVDCHQHLVFDGEGTLEEQVVGHTDDELLERARGNARRALEGGVTTLRDLGDRNFVTLSLRDDSGLPTILCSGPPITLPKGHCWYLNGEVADRQAMIAAVRERAERGCDVVKIMATGGNLTPATPAWQSQFSGDDLRAAVETAHQLGLPVAAHCHGHQGISDAVDAGVDTIEHCSFRSEDPNGQPPADLIQKVADSKIPLSATFGRCPDVPIELPPDGVPQWLLTMFDAVGRVRELGGVIVVGTDAGIMPHKPHDVAPHAHEPLLAIGMTQLEVLRALTSGGADALGLTAKGRLAPGADADMVAVEGDLSVDAAAVVNVARVWHLGRLVRS